ncbi:MAG TPA: Rrf2 family transcriptional regulator [Pirellulales bacterium]|jgi:Rrf2 family protein|nr:Rrf2 family transcriptional regulator [Pirellulales bacterium]
MKFSAKTEYACLAVLELARAYEQGEPVRIRTIAEEHGIPARFLVQILLQLKGAGLVNSTRGAAGGYQLMRSPEEITLEEVMSVADGKERLPNPAGAKSPTRRALLKAWRDVALARQEMLRDITFADLVQRAGGEVEQMYHI